MTTPASNIQQLAVTTQDNRESLVVDHLPLVYAKVTRRSGPGPPKIFSLFALWASAEFQESHSISRDVQKCRHSAPWPVFISLVPMCYTEPASLASLWQPAALQAVCRLPSELAPFPESNHRIESRVWLWRQFVAGTTRSGQTPLEKNPSCLELLGARCRQGRGCSILCCCFLLGSLRTSCESFANLSSWTSECKN